MSDPLRAAIVGAGSAAILAIMTGVGYLTLRFILRSKKPSFRGSFFVGILVMLGVSLIAWIGSARSQSISLQQMVDEMRQTEMEAYRRRAEIQRLEDQKRLRDLRAGQRQEVDWGQNDRIVRPSPITDPTELLCIDASVDPQIPVFHCHRP